MNQELLELFKYSFVDCCSKLNEHYDKKTQLSKNCIPYIRSKIKRKQHREP